MQAFIPFLILLVVALIFQAIPMDGTLKRVGFIIIGIAAIVMLFQHLQTF